ncbi:hypothetical protein AMTRI_Chr05g58700 [Amborella trichopoda]
MWFGSRAPILCKVQSRSTAPAMCKMRCDSRASTLGKVQSRSRAPAMCKVRCGTSSYWIIGLQHYVKGGPAIFSFGPVVVLGRFGTCPKVNVKYGQNDFCI